MAFLKVANRAISSLASGVDEDDTEWTLATGEGALFPDSGDFPVTCETEIAKCTSRTGDVLTVSRHEEGTDAAAHAEGKAVKLRITAGIIEEIQDVLDGGIDKTHLSQDFGPSSARLLNMILTPISNAILQIEHSRTGPFTALINGAPTATSVVYDGEANESFFNGLQAGAGYWGRIVLRNTTRGNSRKVVSVNLDTNTITTESSTDDWADGDNLTTQSQINAFVGMFDVDLSASVPATWAAILINGKLVDNSGDPGGTTRDAWWHPYEALDYGKLCVVGAYAANSGQAMQFWIPVISQKMCMHFRNSTDVATWSAVIGHAEYADT